MRLIHIVPAIAEEASGPSYSVVRLCESLLVAGNDVDLVALEWAKLENRLHFLKTFPLAFGPMRLGRSPAMARWISQRCTSGRADILHNHGMWQFNSLYPGRASRGSAAQFVQSPRGALSEWAMNHGSSAKRLFWPLFQKPALARVACFHATAESEYEDIRRLGFGQPVAIIPNGIDLPPHVERRQSPQRTLLFLSRIHKKKGIEDLLYAWRSVQSQFDEWQLVIAGDDAGYRRGEGYLDELRALGKKLGLDRAQFVGPRYGADKWAAYRDADLFALPTHSENFGVVVAEALAAGTPVIVSKGAPWPELERKGAGWWVDIGVEPLVKALKAAMSMERATLASVGTRGQAWMARDYGWPEIARRMQGTYRWLLDRTLPVPPWVRED